MKQGLIDSHSHLSQKAFDLDRQEVIERAKAKGIVSILSVGCEPDEFQAEILIAREYPGFVLLALGYHPHIAKDINPSHYESLKELINKTEGVIAVGEIGLDYYYKHSTPEEQESVFRKQLRIAGEACLPVIIHCREAYTQMIQILKSADISAEKTLIHCFSGNIEQAEELLSWGATLSFAGPITYPKAEGLRDVLRLTPFNRILVETDAPYLSPQAFRGKRNEPSYITETYAQIAKIKGIEPEHLIKRVATNFSDLFDLDPSALRLQGSVASK